MILYIRDENGRELFSCDALLMVQMMTQHGVVGAYAQCLHPGTLVHIEARRTGFKAAPYSPSFEPSIAEVAVVPGLRQESDE